MKGRAARDDFGGAAGRRLAIVSLHAHRELAPRGERTRQLAGALSRSWDIEVVAPPPDMQTGGAAGRGRSSPARALARRVVGSALLDKWEPWSLRRLGRWRPDADAALLIGHPFSPVVHAARRLAAAGVPYVVDSGDPWVLTAPRVGNAGIGLARARSAERFVWSNAAGAVLTTPQQAEDLRALFPSLPTLVRPNGYGSVEPASRSARRPPPAGDELRLLHLGMLSWSRLDVRPLLRTLCESGGWRRIVFSQFGDDFSGALDSAPDCVRVERCPACGWDEVVRRAADHDVAVVVGNVDPTQLPSKAIQYLTLPIPRLAITSDSTRDALAAYVRSMPGWLVVSPEDPSAAGKVGDHLARPWSDGDLEPPPDEGWPTVAETVADFVDDCVAGGGRPAPERGADRAPSRRRG